MTDFIVRLFEALGPLGKPFPYHRPGFIQLTKFIMVGAVSSMINLTLLYSLTEYVGLYYLYSAAIALFVSTINGYTLNHLWTFKTLGIRRHHHALPKYLLLSASTYVLNLSVLGFLVETFGIWYILAEIIAILVALFGNFLGSKYWAFR